MLLNIYIKKCIKNINEVFDHVVQSENEIKIRDKDVSAPFFLLLLLLRLIASESVGFLSGLVRVKSGHKMNGR